MAGWTYGPSISGQMSTVVQGRVPVLVGITDPSFITTIQMAQIAKDAGATAVVLTTPYYFPIEQDELIRYVDQILDGIDLPLMLYNMPSLTKNYWSIETVQTLAQRHANIVGIKDSSGDLDYFAKLCQLKQTIRPDWTVMIGPEHLTAKAIQLGADGGVNGGSNVEPELFVSLYHAAATGNESQLTQVMKRVMAFQEIYEVTGSTSGFRFVSATKCAVSLRKLCDNVLAEPFTPLKQDERQKIQQILATLPEVSID